MVKLSRLLKDYREAGSVNGLLALWGFVDEHTFLTKAGAVGVMFQLEGVDYECLDHAQRRDVVHDYEQALRQLDERFRVYQYLVKRPAPPIATAGHRHPIVEEALARRTAYLSTRAEELFTIELFLVVLYEQAVTTPTTGTTLEQLWAQPIEVARRLFSVAHVSAILDEQVTRACGELHRTAQAFAGRLADSARPRLLPKGDVFRMLRHLLNYDEAVAAGFTLKYDTHLDFFVSDSSVECQRDHLVVGDQRVRVLTMKEPPARTYANLMQGLYAVPASLIACLEWKRIPDAKARGDVQSRRRHFFNRKVALVNYVSPQTKPEEMLVDDSASATVAELGQCLTELEVHGQCFGATSLSIVLHDHDAARLDRAVANCTKVFAAHDGSLFDERYNLLNAWLAIMPGNTAHNLRRLALLNTNCADLSFLFTLHTGTRTAAHLGGREYLAAFETEHHAPYFWNLHVGDVGHALVLGSTGSGKSFLLNFLITHAQKYDPTTVIFDLGGSYEKLTTRLGGSVWRIGLTHRDFTINPFCLQPTREHLHFLASFVRVLLRPGTEAPLTTGDEREIAEAVENLYTLEAPQRRLMTLSNLLPRELATRLQPWVQGGPYGDLFDHADDTLTFQALQCFDFAGLDRYPSVLEPLLFYVLHRASAGIQDPTAAARLKLFVIDEAWRFARDATVRAYIAEGLKTWRKRNAAMILATQSSEDFGHSDLLRTVVESCPTKFFLANPDIDLGAARHLFHLNETEASLLAGLKPRQQLLLKRPDHAKVLNLRVDPQSYWIYTNTPLDNQRMQDVAARYGAETAVDMLATS